MAEPAPAPSEHAARVYEQAEANTAKAAERIVGSEGFGSMLGQLAENTAAISRLASDTPDVVLRNLRLAGRRDVVRLSRQPVRTEDKLERVRQVAKLRHELSHRPAPSTKRGGPRSGAARHEPSQRS